TREALEDDGGPLGVESLTIANPNGWAGGTVIYPTAEGSYPTVTIIAGLGGVMQTMEWVANALAPWGFVAVATECSPTSSMSTDDRGKQMSAAFDQLLALNEDSSSPLFGKLNGRYGVAGHSLGGGGTFHALINDSRVEAGMPMAPANIDSHDLSAITKPTFLIACSTDDLCSPASVEGYYGTMNQAEKLYVNMDSSTVSRGHLCVQTTEGAQLRPLQNLLARAWFSYWLRDDDRFATFLCGDEAQADNSAVVGWQDTCEF
ncbi:hypothetical protein ACFL5O_08610, partial [Myxococcota bacterium]